MVVSASPIHGFNYPPVMINFIMRIPRGENPVVLMNTLAGMLIGKWITPGRIGIAFLLAVLALRIKNLQRCRVEQSGQKVHRYRKGNQVSLFYTGCVKL